MNGAAGADVEGLRARAVDLHRDGRTDAAAALYAELLAVVPDDLTALHMLGLIALAGGRADAARALLSRATARYPLIATLHADLGAAFAALGMGAQARSSLDRALALEPGHLLARVRRGAFALETGEATDALADAQAALEQAPDCVPAERVRAGALAALGRAEEALAGYRRLLELKVGDAAAALGAMTLLLALGRPLEAIEAADRALAAHPTLAQAHANRGVALLRLGRAAEALASLSTALNLAPGLAESHVNLASALAALGQPGAALAACERALALDPGCAPALRSRALALFELGRVHASLQAYEQALAVDPASVAAHLGHATALRSLGRVAQACVALEAALALDPTHALARFHLADCSLHLGRYAAGWEHYEARRLLPGAVRHEQLAGREWSGVEDIAGRTVFVCFEQAIGDTFQFVRYVRLLEERRARVVLCAPRALHALLASVSPALTLVDEHASVPRYDFHVPLMSLPRAFGTDAATIPARVPYLAADPARVAAWRARLGDHGIRIGVAWSGAARRSGGGRSYPLAALAPLAALPGVRLISLQRNAGADELGALPAGLVVELPPGEVDAGADRFIDTAAIMVCVDLVVSCDTSIAHLAGALARPVWTALKFMPDWRWGTAGERSPWYPTMRLFRQEQRWQWGPVFAAMARELARARGLAAPPVPAGR